MRWRRAERAAFAAALATGVVLLASFAGFGFQALALRPFARWPSPAHESAAAVLDRAQAALSAGDLQSADRLSAEAMASGPADALVAQRAGAIALQAGDQVAAETDFRAGELADGRDPANFLALARLDAQRGDIAAAETQYRAALAGAPDAPSAHFELGLLEMREGIYAAALSDFQAELARSPDFEPAQAASAAAEANLNHDPVDRRTRAKADSKPEPGGPARPSRVETGPAWPGSVRLATASPVLRLATRPPAPGAVASPRSAPAPYVARATRRNPTARSLVATPQLGRAAVQATASGLPEWNGPRLPPIPEATPPPLWQAPPAPPGVIPNVIGMTTSEAIAALEGAGYRVEHMTLVSGTRFDARVVNTEPDPGATTPPGNNSVDLILAGPRH